MTSNDLTSNRITSNRITSNKGRASSLVAALHAGIDGDLELLASRCTDAVRVWSPSLSMVSKDELLAELSSRGGVFTDVVLDAVPLDVGGDYACVEWTVSMTHSGALVSSDDQTIEATGARVVVRGVTVAEFAGDLICSVRQYWDETSLLEQLAPAAVAG
jgi:hypothetical protein